MKKIILILAVTLFGALSCNKSSKTSQEPLEAYCIYNNSVSPRVFISCEKTLQDAQNKCKQLRDAGTPCESVKKSTCSDC